MENNVFYTLITDMTIKLIFIIIFIFIILSMVFALFHLVKNKDPEQSGKTVKALTIRIGLSLLLFIMLFVVYSMGLIKPEGIGARIHMQNQTSIRSPTQ